MPQTDLLTIATGIHKKVVKLMGNRFEISVVGEDEDVAAASIQKAIEEIQRIEK